jgi:hypothetical protein
VGCGSGCFKDLDVFTDGRGDKTKKSHDKDITRKHKALAYSAPRGTIVNYNISTVEAEN